MIIEQYFIENDWEKYKGDPNEDWYYYAFEICEGIRFLSSASDEVSDGEWTISMFNVGKALTFDDEYLFDDFVRVINEAIELSEKLKIN